jgi:hypothetical protein
VLLDL